MTETIPLLEVDQLAVFFETHRGTVRAVDKVSLAIAAGQTVALVGESGCGKTVTALALTRLLPEPPARYPSGRILLDGRDVLRLPLQEMTEIRGREIAYVFQDPASALHPVQRVFRQVCEAVLTHDKAADADVETRRLFRIVGLGDSKNILRAYPHMLSGGMQQRVTIAMALASRPRLLVADEPTTALDVTVQAEILDLLRSLQRSFNMALLLITHNLGIVAEMAHITYIMYSGQIVESGPTRAVLSSPLHPYTKGLLSAVPTLNAPRGELTGIPGSLPDPTLPLCGCRFAPRCNQAEPLCHRREADLVLAEEGHWVRCWAIAPRIPSQASRLSYS